MPDRSGPHAQEATSDTLLDAVDPAQLPQENSSAFASAWVEPAGSYAAPGSDGDLWPTCWAEDDYVYTANGDGRGFSDDTFEDLVVNRIAGTPETGLTGERLAASAQVAAVWGDPKLFNRKPTGMVCVNGVLYLAVQDLRYGDDAFNDVPNASISRSDDHGRTWKITEQAMFTDYRFTTIMFADFGKDSEHAVPALGADDGRYVYAYGLDWNWRASFNGIVPDPIDLYLARVPDDAVQDRARWEFFVGLDDQDRPRWSSRITDKVPVLHEPMRRYPDPRPGKNGSDTIIAQGGVLYNAPLRRYLYSTWTAGGLEFFEAPQPWGPWRRFKYHNTGLGPWRRMADTEHTPKNAGYGTTMPSKYVNADGTKLWLQSNWWVGPVPEPDDNYNFNLRRVELTPYRPSRPSNSRSDDNLARSVDGVRSYQICAGSAHPHYANDGDREQHETSDDQMNKGIDFWGYLFPAQQRMNELIYVAGPADAAGGWFTAYAGGLRVQVRRDFIWHDVTGLTVTPDYPYAPSIENGTEYRFTFHDTHGDGIRLIGQPGGTDHYTSITELEVYYR
ncbi:DUF4185 domain-containing protein [Microlunatus soli]|uniref:DUF4185 domain-containing protein n=1 Tax=Microlunatus soli TaxID=630515 RepID=A0A1H2ALQ0_9ACTN|nr:DUF4185 domain-containing protein [Microlunatus soli]SDT46841.1 protein of unknown function [Microlunatus soli]